MSDRARPIKKAPSFRPATAPQIEPPKVNALWRIPTWFPQLDAGVQEKLKVYHAALLKFNARLNLISRNTERESDEVHFADCILAARIALTPALGNRVFDIGSGNGFPGLVFAAMDPSREFLAVESDLRKSEFLKHVISELGLKNASVVNLRFETMRSSNVKAAVCRGFASVAKTLLSSNKVFEKGGIFLHMKGNTWSKEVGEMPSQLISVWHPKLAGEYNLPASQTRRAVLATTKE